MSERDIVERLRDQGTRFGYIPGQLPHDEYSAIGQDMHEAADEIERLRSAPGETEPSVSTRTSERGLSYHNETEALREASEALYKSVLTHRYDTLQCPNCIAKAMNVRRALSQHVGGEG